MIFFLLKFNIAFLSKFAYICINIEIIITKNFNKFGFLLLILNALTFHNYVDNNRQFLPYICHRVYRMTDNSFICEEIKIVLGKH